MIEIAADPANPTLDSGTLEPVVAVDVPEDNDALGDEIARVAAHIHAAEYRLLVLIRAFDEREGWGSGFQSCAHWLSWRTGIGPGPAREKVRVARALADLPLISQAMARGELSFSKVRALTRVADPDNEEALLSLARQGTAAHLEKLVRYWRLVDGLEDADAEALRHERRFLTVHPEEDGSWVIRGRLDPEVGALIQKALDWACDALFRGEDGGEAREAGPSAEQRRADALGLLAERALVDEEGGPVGRSHRFQVLVNMDVRDVSAETSGPEARGSSRGSSRENVEGARGELPLPLPTTRRLACDASVIPMLSDSQGKVLDVGRKRRTVPPALRRALERRDGGCRFPGCGCRYTDAHHINHWADGGATRMDNLVLLCRRHHRAVHEGGMSVEMTHGGTEVLFRRPDGRPVPVVPMPPAVPEDPLGAIMETNRAAGIDPGPWTPTPGWFGEPMDYGLAIDTIRGGPRGEVS